VTAPSQSAPAAAHHTPTAHHTPASDLPDTPAVSWPDTPAVSWPDPSPLQHWWTEVMDGALAPAATPSDRA